MRLFIGISPTAEIRKGLVKAQNYLQRHGITGSWTTQENMHLTLAFIGEYPNPDPVLDVMESIFFSPFDITYSHIGTFRNSIVWGGIEPCAPLENLVKHLRHELTHADIPFDNAAFAPHFTLARHADFSKGIPPTTITPVTMMVDRIVLYRSDRGKNGMVYTEIGWVEALNG